VTGLFLLGQVPRNQYKDENVNMKAESFFLLQLLLFTRY